MAEARKSGIAEGLSGDQVNPVAERIDGLIRDHWWTLRELAGLCRCSPQHAMEQLQDLSVDRIIFRRRRQGHKSCGMVPFEYRILNQAVAVRPAVEKEAAA